MSSSSFSTCSAAIVSGLSRSLRSTVLSLRPVGSAGMVMSERSEGLRFEKGFFFTGVGSGARVRTSVRGIAAPSSPDMMPLGSLFP